MQNNLPSKFRLTTRDYLAPPCVGASARVRGAAPADGSSGGRRRGGRNTAERGEGERGAHDCAPATLLCVSVSALQRVCVLAPASVTMRSG